MKSATKLIAICAFLLGSGYAACTLIAPTHRVRYRLTMDIGVDGVLRRGSGVVEFSYLLLPEALTRGLGGAQFHGNMRGNAISVDLGERGVLFVVNSPPVLQSSTSNGSLLFPKLVSLASLPLVAYGFPGYGTSSHMQAVFSELGQRRGSVDVKLEDLPMLLHFRDINKPGPAYEVNPQDLEKSFGKGARIMRAQLELTNEELSLIPRYWPDWLVHASSLRLLLLSDDDNLRVSSSEIWTNEFKGE